MIAPEKFQAYTSFLCNKAQSSRRWNEMDHTQPEIFIHYLQNAPVCHLKMGTALSNFGLE